MRKYGILFIIILISLGVKTPKTCTDKLALLENSYRTHKAEITKLEVENNVFTLALGASESTNRATICNSIGAMGMWQFMQGTLKDLGFGYVTSSRFRRNPNIFPLEMQRIALNKKITTDLEQFEDQWFRSETEDINYLDYIGKTVNGVKITKAGIIASAHLGGAYGTMLMLDSKGKYNPADINKTSLIKYLAKFSEYNYTNEKEITIKKVCLEQTYIKSKLLILLRSLSKLSQTQQHSKGMVIASISKLVPKLHWKIGVENPNSKKYLWDLKQHCLNIIEPSCNLGVQQLQGITFGQPIVMVKLSGIIVKNGMVWFMERKRRLYQKTQDYFNFILNLCGTLHGGLKSLIYSPRTKSYLLMNLKLPEVVLGTQDFNT